MDGTGAFKENSNVNILKGNGKKFPVDFKPLFMAYMLPICFLFFLSND